MLSKYDKLTNCIGQEELLTNLSVNTIYISTINLVIFVATWLLKHVPVKL